MLSVAGAGSIAGEALALEPAEAPPDGRGDCPGVVVGMTDALPQATVSSARSVRPPTRAWLEDDKIVAGKFGDAA